MIKALIKKAGNRLKRFRRSGKGQYRPPAPTVQDTQQQQPASAVDTAQSHDHTTPPTQQKSEHRKYRRENPVKKRKNKPGWTPEKFPIDPIEGKSRFHDFHLPNGLMHAIADLDFKYCTPIQEKALPDAMAGKDLIGRAGTGTGKSAVFLIALFSRLLKENRDNQRNRNKVAPKPGCPRALIIAPTRELVMQIAKDGQDLAKYSHLRIVAVYGGTDYQKQERMLTERPVDVVVATPGRLLDYASKKVINLKQAGIMVIDEADRMLDMGFIPDVRRIIYMTPAKEKRQTMLFSATVTEDVKHLASQWCIKPVSIESEPEQVTIDTVEQLVYMTTSDDKYNVLYNLITTQEHERILVFTNMKSDARRLYDRLRRNDINCTMLTGDVPQQKRMTRLESFRDGRVKVMIATDVAGRGIHIEGISHVVNYTLPYEPEDYVHRIGRTGRAGKSGISISFACEEGAFYLPDIEEYIGKPLACTNPPEELLVKAPAGTKKIQQSSRPRHGKSRGNQSRKRRR